MNRVTLSLTIGFLMVLYLLFVPVAGENTPVSLISVSGNTSTISALGDESYQILLSEPIQIKSLADNSSKNLSEIIILKPSQAAILVHQSDGNESVMMVETSELIVNETNQTALLNFTPLEFYEGILLTPYDKRKGMISPGSYENTSILLEVSEHKTENANGPVFCTPEQNCLQRIDNQCILCSD